MVVDTGAAVSMVSLAVYQKHISRLPLKESSLQLSTYTAQKIGVAGELDVGLCYHGQCQQLKLHDAKGEKPSLLGRDRLGKLKLAWRSLGVFAIEKPPLKSPVDTLLQKYADVFWEGVGKVEHLYDTSSFKSQTIILEF